MPGGEAGHRAEGTDLWLRVVWQGHLIPHRLPAAVRRSSHTNYFHLRSTFILLTIYSYFRTVEKVQGETP